jgi:hypothetical protein
MSESIITVLTAVLTPLGALLTAVFMRKKHNAEVEQLKTQIEISKTDVRTHELENVDKGMEILMNQVVEPLKKEINELRKEVVRFRKAIARINDCAHATTCPVRSELQNKEYADEQTA